MGLKKLYIGFLVALATTWCVVSAVAPCTEHGGTEEWCSTYQLHWAAQAGDKREVIRLLSRGFRDINQKTRPGLSTPLHAAASAGRSDMAKLLISRGAIINVSTKGAETPLDRANTRYCTHVDPDYSVCLLAPVDYDGTIEVLQKGCSAIRCHKPLKCDNNICVEPIEQFPIQNLLNYVKSNNHYFNRTVGFFWRNYRQY